MIRTLIAAAIALLFVSTSAFAGKPAKNQAPTIPTPVVVDSVGTIVGIPLQEWGSQSSGNAILGAPQFDEYLETLVQVDGSSDVTVLYVYPDRVETGNVVYYSDLDCGDSGGTPYIYAFVAMNRISGTGADGTVYVQQADAPVQRLVLGSWWNFGYQRCYQTDGSSAYDVVDVEILTTDFIPPFKVEIR